MSQMDWHAVKSINQSTIVDVRIHHGRTTEYTHLKNLFLLPSIEYVMKTENQIVVG